MATRCSVLHLHAVQVDENEEVSSGYQTPTSPPKSELALQKGFRRRTWTGPAWLDNVTSTGHVSHSVTDLHLLLLLVPGVCCIRKNQVSAYQPDRQLSSCTVLVVTICCHQHASSDATCLKTRDMSVLGHICTADRPSSCPQDS